MSKKTKEYLRMPCRISLLHCKCSSKKTALVDVGIVRIFPYSIKSFRRWPSHDVSIPRTNQDCLYDELIKFGNIYYISPAKKNNPLVEIKQLRLGEATSHIVVTDKIFEAIQMYVGSDYRHHMTLYEFLNKVL